jgi:hypothetical protein
MHIASVVAVGTTMGTRGGVWGSKSRGGEYEGKRGVRPLAPGDWRWRTFAERYEVVVHQM